MQEYELSVLIPSRNELFLRNTVEDILKNKRGKTEIIIGLDGKWSNPPIKDHPDVTILHVSESIGQRAMTNRLCNLSRSKFIMKLDAHCSWDEGYDQKMLDAFKETGDNVTMVGTMRNLWVFDWKCMKCGHQTYQGPTPTKCEKCDNTTKFERVMYWIGKKSPQSNSFCFDSEPHFQYFNEYTKRPEYQEALKTGFTETMSLQGSCWMMSRERYLEYMPFREQFGSWGNEGLEMACREWLSGGKVIVNHKTWYAHLFRTQGAEFGFPYPQSGREVQKTKKVISNMLFQNRFPKQIRPLSWLINRFSPVPDWHDEKGKKKLAEVNKAGEEFYISHPRPKAESLSKSL